MNRYFTTTSSFVLLSGALVPAFACDPDAGEAPGAHGPPLVETVDDDEPAASAEPPEDFPPIHDIGPATEDLVVSTPTTAGVCGNGLWQAGDVCYSAATTMHTSPSGIMISLATGDLNGDGNMDWAAVEGADVRVCLGNDLGGCSSTTLLVSNVSRTGDLAHGNFNSSASGGFRDLVISDYVGGELPVFWGGASGWGPVDDWAGTSGQYPVNIAVGRIDGDSFDDLAVFNWGDDSVDIYTAWGPLNGSPSATYIMGGDGGDVEFADCDGDGDRDLIAAGGWNALSVRKNNGSGVFGVAASFGLGLATDEVVLQIRLADFDGDTDQDFVGTTSTGRMVRLLNSGACVFSAAAVADLDASTARPGGELWALHIDNDGVLDLLVSVEIVLGTTSRIQAYLGQGNGSFVGPHIIATDPQIADVVWNDFVNHTPPLFLGPFDIVYTTGGAMDVKILKPNP